MLYHFIFFFPYMVLYLHDKISRKTKTIYDVRLYSNNRNRSESTLSVFNAYDHNSTVCIKRTGFRYAHGSVLTGASVFTLGTEKTVRTNSVAVLSGNGTST